MHPSNIVIVEPETGRQANIRAHLLGVPIDETGEKPVRMMNAIRMKWGIAAALLRVSKNGAELELLGVLDAEPGEWVWTQWVPDPPIRERTEWERPGWLRRCTNVIDRELTRIGRRRTGWPQQVRHTTLNALLRIPTDCGVVWFKTGLTIFSHESEVVSQLGRLRPRGVPAVIASGPTWWLSEAFPSEQVRPQSNPFSALADLQLAAVNSVPTLVGRGCPACDLAQLGREISTLANRPDLVDSPRAESLIGHGAILEQMCAEVSSLGLPECIVHGDFHAGNRRWTENGWFLYDWTDSLVSHPFLDLSIAFGFDTPLQLSKARAAYSTRWKREFPEVVIDRAMEFSQPLGAAHQAINYMRIADGLPGVVPDNVKGEIDAWIDRFVRAVSI